MKRWPMRKPAGPALAKLLGLTALCAFLYVAGLSGLFSRNVMRYLL